MGGEGLRLLTARRYFTFLPGDGEGEHVSPATKTPRGAGRKATSRANGEAAAAPAGNGHASIADP